MAESEGGRKVLGKNRKAYFNYEVLESLEAGVVLVGTEVKSLRLSHFNFADAYASIEKNELWLMGFNINIYTQGNIHNHVPAARRKLLVKREEINKLRRKTEEKGLTLVPLSVYLKGGLIKFEIGVCRGKKNYDKRETIKQKDMKRDADRDIKGR